MAHFSFDKRESTIVVALFLVAFTVRLLLFPVEGLRGDIHAFQTWFSTAAQSGIRTFYSAIGCDYPPFDVYIFWFFGSIANMASAWSISAANIVKLVPTLFDVGTAALIYFFLRKRFSFKQSLLGTSLYAFNPAVIYDSAVWGQFDAVYTFFLVLSLMLALESKPKSAAAVFAVGLLIKPQAIALAPILVYLIFRKNGLKNLLHSVAVSAATFFIVILPFEWSNPVTFLGNAYFGAYNGYRVTSVNAFNFWGFFGFWAPDISFYMIGLALFGVSAGLTLFVLHKRFNVSGEWLVLFSAFMLLFAFFMLPTRIHERYLFPAFSMLALTFFSVKHSRILYAALTGTFLFNLSYVLISSNAADIAGRATPNLTGDPLALMVSAVNLGLFLYATVVILAELKVKGAHSNELGRDASTLSRL